MLSLTRYELLEACNEIAKRYGGRHIGMVEGYRNQWLIAVELRDMRELRAWTRSMVVLAGKDPTPLDDDGIADDYCWIRCGFCQTQIQRAPDGGFELRIPYEILERCRTREHVIAYFQTWLGTAEERERKWAEWEALVDAVVIESPGLRRAIRMTWETQEILAQEAHYESAGVVCVG